MTNESKLSKTWYSAKGLWKGHSAAKKLSTYTGIGEEEARRWLEKQKLWQIYLPPPKYIPRPTWKVSEPNKVHQADLLFLPHDTFGGKKYRYALVIIDVASRYKDAEALVNKESNTVAKAFGKIYSRRLSWPEVLMVDSGKEFMGKVTKLVKEHYTILKRGEPKNHRAQSFVERANRTIGEKIFSHQYAQEMITDDRSREWVKRLPFVIKALNNQKTRLTGEEPDDSIDFAKVSSVEKKYERPVGLEENILSSFAKVRYLYAPGENEGGEVRRATDPVWSLNEYNISSSVVSEDQPILYYLSKGAPKRSFVREELQIVPPDTETPPTFVIKR